MTIERETGTDGGGCAPDQSPPVARTPEEALAAIRALCEQAMLSRFREEDVRAVLDSVTPAPPLDRAQALKAAEEGLVDYRRRRSERYRGPNAVAMADEHDTWIAGHGTEVEAIVDAVLALVRPVEGVVLTRPEAQYVRRLMWKQQSWDRDEQALAERLEAAS